MGTLDGLREEIATLHIPRPTLNTERGANIAVKHALALIDAYEREHPGLCDFTIHCAMCGAVSEYRPYGRWPDGWGWMPDADGEHWFCPEHRGEL